MGSAIMDAGGGSTVPEPTPAPMTGANALPPFLMKTYDMVDDPSTDKIVSWSPADNSFVIWDPPEFAKELLPKYFKHSNFSSFVRQLNTYGFRKVGSDLWKFSNDGFIRGQKHLLRNISRRKPAHGQSQQQQQQQHGQSASVGGCVEVGKFGLETEVEWLNRDKNVLMQELVKLRQHQQTIDSQMQTMVQNLQTMEQRQQQMMSFLAKAVNSPGFLAQFVQQQNDNNKRMMEGNKKRRIRQDIPLDDHSVSPADGQLVKYQPVMTGAAKEMFRQMPKLNSSPRLENFSNSPESSPTGDALDGGSNNRISGVTLQEVSPSFSKPITSATSAIAGQSLLSANIQFSESNSLVGAQDLPPILPYSSDMIVPVPSQLQEIVPENNKDTNGLETGNDFFMDPTLWGNGKLPLEIDIFSPDLQIKWESALIDDIGEPPSVGDPSWEKFLQSLYPSGTEEMDSVEIENIKSTEAEPLENGRGNVQHMEHLTEQMGLLTPNSK